MQLDGNDGALCGGSCHRPKRPIVRPRGFFESKDSFDLRLVEIPAEGGDNDWTFCVVGCEQLYALSMLVHVLCDVAGRWKDEGSSSLLMWWW